MLVAPPAGLGRDISIDEQRPMKVTLGMGRFIKSCRRDTLSSQRLQGLMV
jgi:hypothetical protein